MNGPILLTGALNWKSADNLSVNISYFKADHFSRNTRLMFLFVILNLHLLDSRSWGEEEKQQLVVWLAGLRKALPFLHHLHSRLLQLEMGRKEVVTSPGQGLKPSLVATSHSDPHQAGSDLCSVVLRCQKMHKLVRDRKGIQGEWEERSSPKYLLRIVLVVLLHSCWVTA